MVNTLKLAFKWPKSVEFEAKCLHLGITGKKLGHLGHSLCATGHRIIILDKSNETKD